MSTLMRRIAERWQCLWFQSETSFNLDVIRMGLGFCMLFAYAGLTPYVGELYSDQGWISDQAVYLYRDHPWFQSLFFYLPDQYQLAAHWVFLVSCLLFAVGWKTRYVKWLVLVFQISYAYRNPLITYGVDSILCSVLFILCLAPIGHSLSLDRWAELKRAKLQDLHQHPPAYQSIYLFMFRRLVQIQMAIFFLFAGIEKLRGEYWWSGDALWVALNNYEYTNIPLGFFAEHYWLINLLTYFTLLVEAGYFYLIWQRSTRPWFLGAAITLHLGIAILMGLYYFSLVMIFCHLSFVRREWYTRLFDWWRNKMGRMEMIYDGECGFCKRSMAWTLAFDGLQQISIRDYRRSASPLVSKEESDLALYAVNHRDEKFAGFDAYRYVVLRVPGLWWLVPLFYIPWLSRAVGRPLYLWIASHRHVISSCTG